MKRKALFFSVCILYILIFSVSYTLASSSVNVESIRTTPNHLLTPDIAPRLIIKNTLPIGNHTFSIHLDHSNWLSDRDLKSHNFRKDMTHDSPELMVKRVNNETVTFSVYNQSTKHCIYIPLLSKPTSHKDLTFTVKGLEPYLSKGPYVYGYVEEPNIYFNYKNLKSFKGNEYCHLDDLECISSVQGSLPSDKGSIQLTLDQGFYWQDQGKIHFKDLDHLPYTLTKNNRVLTLNMNFSSLNDTSSIEDLFDWEDLSIKALENAPNGTVHVQVTGNFINKHPISIASYTKNTSSTASNSQTSQSSSNDSHSTSHKESTSTASTDGIEKPIKDFLKEIEDSNRIYFSMDHDDFDKTNKNIDLSKQGMNITISKKQLESTHKDLKFTLCQSSPVSLLRCLKDGSVPMMLSRVMKLYSNQNVSHVTFGYSLKNNHSDTANVFVKGKDDYLHGVSSHVRSGKIYFDMEPKKEYIILEKKPSSFVDSKVSIKDTVQDFQETGIEKPIEDFMKDIENKNRLFFAMSPTDLKNTNFPYTLKKDTIELIVSKNLADSLIQAHKHLEFTLYQTNPFPFIQSLDTHSIPMILSRGMKLYCNESIDAIQVSHVIDSKYKDLAAVFMKNSNHKLQTIPSHYENGRIYFMMKPKKEYIILEKKLEFNTPVENELKEKEILDFMDEFYEDEKASFIMKRQDLYGSQNPIVTQQNNIELLLFKNVLDPTHPITEDLEFTLYESNPISLIRSFKTNSLPLALSKTLKLSAPNWIHKVRIGYPVKIDSLKDSNVFVKDIDGLHYVPSTYKSGHIYFDVYPQKQYILLKQKITFNDIHDSMYESEIENLSSKKILSGFDSMHFKPKETLTRAQTSAILIKALALDTFHHEIYKIFTDVNPTDWYGKYVYIGYKNLVLHGTGNYRFSPNTSVTHEQFIQLMINAYEKHKGSVVVSNEEINAINNCSPWAKQAIAKAKKINLLKEFHPICYNNVTKREEAAFLVSRLLDYISSL